MMNYSNSRNINLSRIYNSQVSKVSSIKYSNKHINLNKVLNTKDNKDFIINKSENSSKNFKNIE